MVCVSGLKSTDVYSIVCVFMCVSVYIYFLYFFHCLWLSRFGLIYLVSGEMSVINQIIAVEKIASKPMSSLKMTIVPAVPPYCKIVGRFSRGL